MKNRISPHRIETQTCDIVRTIIDKDGVALYRDITGRDYGIDAIIEIFDDGRVTGKFALLQIKGKQRKIVPLKSGVISCKITASNAEYAFQHNIPVVLVTTSLEEKENFYYVALQEVITKEHLRKIEAGQKEITVHIPVNSCIIENKQGFFKLVESFYSRT